MDSYTGIFSSQSVYTLECGVEQEEGSKGVWNHIWKSKFHERLKLFLWRMASECKDNLWRRIHKGDNICTLCREEEESTLHVLSRCSVRRAVAFSSTLGIQLDSINVSNSIDLVSWCLSLPCSKEVDLPLVLVCFFYSIWNWRNDKLFNGNKDVAQVVGKVYQGVCFFFEREEGREFF